MFRIVALGVLLFAGACAGNSGTADPLSDAPEWGSSRAAVFTDAPSYAQALRLWRSPEDVNAWMGARFAYDMDRAARLSETQRGKGKPVDIHEPEDFFAKPSGVCVDIARFAVETVRAIQPELKARYLMLDFDPAVIQGNVLRKHWVAVFSRGDEHYIFADSKRPGHMAGPYASVSDFVAEYEQYRQRKVLSFQERDSYKRTSRVRAKEPAM